MLFVFASVAMAALIKGVAEREAVAHMHSVSWCRNDSATVRMHMRALPCQLLRQPDLKHDRCALLPGPGILKNGT